MSRVSPLVIGRYALFDEIAAGGMATVHIGRLLGAAGFSRVVAIKRLHSQYAKHPDFVPMLIDEAHLAARIRHPNVVPTLDVVQTDDELFLVMEYVQGEALSRLLRAARKSNQRPEPGIAAAITAGMLHGLHAAHTAKGERGEPLEIVHRDVSPQNVIVGTDGVARLLDFGIAQARGRLQTTRQGEIKGKFAYMAPEQLSGDQVGPYTDVYAAAAVLWEALAGRRLFRADHEAALVGLVLAGASEPPSAHTPGLPVVLDEITMRGLAKDPAARFPSAREMAMALEKSLPLAGATEVGQWVEDLASGPLSERAERIAAIESRTDIPSLVASIVPARKPDTSVQHETSNGVPDDQEQTSRVGEERRSLSVAHSQLSSISVASDSGAARAPRPSRRQVVIGVAAAAVVVGGLVAYLSVRELMPSAGAQAPDPGTSGAEFPTTSATASTASSPSVGGSVTAAAGAGSGDPSSSSSGAAAAGAGRPRRLPTRASPTAAGGSARAITAPPAGGQCTPPYTVDDQGFHHIKPECLH